MQQAKTGVRTRTWKVAALAAAMIACVPQVPNSVHLSQHANNHLTTGELHGSISMLVPLPDRFSFAVIAYHWRNRLLPLHGPVVVYTKKEAEKVREKRNANKAGLSATRVNATTTSSREIQADESTLKIVALNAPTKSIKARKINSARKVRRWRPQKKFKTKPTIKTAENWTIRALFPDAAY